MKHYIIAFIFGVALAAFLLSLAERDPLASHADYMQREYGQAYLDAFRLNFEIKIDQFLLELEAR